MWTRRPMKCTFSLRPLQWKLRLPLLPLALCFSIVADCSVSLRIVWYALLQPRAATITAVVPSKCAVMDRAAFLRLLGPMKDLLEVGRGLACQVCVVELSASGIVCHEHAHGAQRSRGHKHMSTQRHMCFTSPHAALPSPLLPCNRTPPSCQRNLDLYHKYEADIKSAPPPLTRAGSDLDGEDGLDDAAADLAGASASVPL
jgi:hypothetical protein